jgi:nitroreductase
MNVAEAIKFRKSIRGFKPEPVPKEVLAEVLELARWAPSGVNCQSWEFVVVTGEALRALGEANKEQFALGAESSPILTNPRLPDPYHRRRVELARKLYGLLGIAREDKVRRREWEIKDMTFFDAPAAILICSDEEAAEPRSTFEAGVASQTIALAALHFGLGTCIVARPVYYPDAVKKVLRLPESKRIYIGIAIGYPDWEHPANRIQTDREPLSALTFWRD